MQQDLSKLIQKRYNKAQSEYMAFQSLRTECYRFCAPSRNGFLQIGKGQDNTLTILNDHPITAVKQFAANVTQLLCPVGNKFFSLKSSKYLPQQQQEIVNKVIAPLSDMIFTLITDSNFYQALNESCIDLAIGTGAMLLTYTGIQDDPIKFTSLDMSKLYFSEDETGLIGNVFRNIIDMPLDEAEAIYPNANFNVNSGQDTISFTEGVVRDIQNKCYIYVLFDTGSFKIYQQTKRNTNPFIVFRWGKLASEQIGRGIALDLLGTMRVANQMVSDILTQSSFVVNPPIFTTDKDLLSGKNKTLKAGTVYTINAISQSPVFPLQLSASNLAYGIQQVQQYNQDIDNALMTNILGQVGGSTMTATEVEGRLKIAGNVFGSAFGRLQKEFLAQSINGVIDILISNGYMNTEQLPKNVRIEYSSPVLNIQKQGDVNKLVQVLQIIAQINGQDAQTAINMAIDQTQVPQWLIEKIGADASLFNSTDQIRQTLQQKQSMAQAQQLQQQIQNQALTGQINTGAPSGKPI